MLPLSGTWGFGFIFLRDVKSPRLLGRSEGALVGGWVGTRKNRRLGVRLLMIPAGGIPTKKEAGSELRKLLSRRCRRAGGWASGCVLRKFL